MKNLRSSLFLIFFPLFGLAQSINGIYSGTLSNDSTTVRQDQSFEMALTEYKGKVYGYAYSTFIVNDTLYYIVKRVKGIINGDACEVEDDEVISHNFPKKPEKKVFVTYTLHRSNTDNSWSLDGDWKTNLTKKYYAVSGKVATKEEKDLSKSKLYEHLGDLNLQQTLAFEKPKKEELPKKPVAVKPEKTDIAKNRTADNTKKDVATIDNKSSQPKSEKKDIVSAEPKQDIKALPATSISQNKNTDLSKNNIDNNPQNQTGNKDVVSAEIKPETKKTQPGITTPDIKPADIKNTTAVTNNPVEQNKNPVVTNKDKKTEPAITKNETKLPETKPGITANGQASAENKKDIAKTQTKIPEIANKQPAQNNIKNNKPDNPVISEKKPEVAVAKPENKSPEQTKTIVQNSLPPVEKNDVVTTETNPDDKKVEPSFEFKEINKPNRNLHAASALVDSRESIPTETIYFKADSLVLSLYDNGEVDGDTVSVIINDVVVIDKIRLKSSAYKKTIYYSPDEGDSLLLVLYAENLGLYPPNTGLLVIKDGTEIHYVRFKADFQRNAAIVLRKKYK